MLRIIFMALRATLPAWGAQHCIMRAQAEAVLTILPGLPMLQTAKRLMQPELLLLNQISEIL